MLKDIGITEAELATAKANIERWKKSNKPATVGLVIQTVDDLGEEVAEHVHDLRKAVADLQAKTALLEARSLAYEGVHEKGRTYSPNTLVTHKGGLWVAKELTNTVPGTSNDWKLTHKTPVARGGAK